MKNISLIVDKKVNNKWEETYKTTDEKEIYKALAQNVIAKVSQMQLYPINQRMHKLRRNTKSCCLL